MKRIKRIVAMMTLVMIVVSNDANSITVLAGVTEKTKIKFYGPVNIETVSLSDEDVPDALIDSGEVRKELKDKYVKRLYNEEDLNTIIFENKAGERTMYLFKKPVKYKDENGNVVDKDLSFRKLDESCQGELRARYVCDNGDNDVKVYMPRDISDGIKIMTGDKTVQMSVRTGHTVSDEVTVSEKTVIYDEVFGEGTELKYTPMIDGIKEEIVLQEYNGQTEYLFEVRLDGYKIVTLDDNCLYLENVDNGEIEGIIDSVYMIDDNGVTDFNNYYTYVKKEEGVYEITAHVNEEFLIDENTEYPVVIDPNIEIVKANRPIGIYDATLNSTSITEGKSGSLFVGNRSNGENGISRVVMKFPGLQLDTNNGGVSVVLSASISIRDLMCESSDMGINCYGLVGVDNAWTEDNVSWNTLSMNYNPFTSSGDKMQIVSYSEGIKQAEQHRYVFDITEIVKGWRQGRSGISADRGIAFISSTENKLIYKTFGSYNRTSYNPVFKMSYVPYFGGFELAEYSALISPNGNNGTKPNCLGLAFHTGNNIGPLDIGYTSIIDKNDVEAFAERIVAYVNQGGRESELYASAEFIGTQLSSGISLKYNQHLIAVRLYTQRKYFTFHVIVQMNDGRWVHKNDTLPLEILGYINPDVTKQQCWKRSDGTYYDTVTAYIIMTKK